MTRLFSKIISFACLGALIIGPLIALYLLIKIKVFSSLAIDNLHIAILWQTVTSTQWYSLWAITFAYMAIGWLGIYFLRRAFVGFAKGEFFNEQNSRALKRFSICLFAQALAKPLHFSLASVLLSLNHPAGQKMLSISFGSNELKIIVLAMILWVLSSLLVEASKIENENKQFI